jgi:hypothetical protein
LSDALQWEWRGIPPESKIMRGKGDRKFKERDG